MTITSPAASAFALEWADWRARRDESALAPYGTASLVATNWLTDRAAAVEHVPGSWRAEGAAAVGAGLAGTPLGPVGGALVSREEWTLQPGDELTDGTRILRHFSRGADVAVRVLDPAAETRRRISGIAAWEPARAWVLRGAFVPAPEDGTVDVTTVDGVTGASPYAGVIELTLPDGSVVTLTVTRAAHGLSAVFGDATNGVESYRFRFLGIAEPDADGSVLVDFNRAFLPPCSFSDHYICPLPVPGNRWASPVRAGERAIVLDGHESPAGLH